MSKKLTHIEFVNRIKHLNVFPIEEYMGRAYYIHVMDDYKIVYKVKSDKLLSGKKPSIASAVDKNHCFMVKANHIHKNKYLYTKVDYKYDNQKIVISCKKHGDFKQMPSSHLQGAGCPKCGIESMKLNRAQNGFSRNSWITYCKNKNPKIYVLKCYNENECFIKVGITTRSINGRFWKTNMPYKYDIIMEKRMNAADCYDSEKRIHKIGKPFRYNPQIDFHGKTECFTTGIFDSIGKGVVA